MFSRLRNKYLKKDTYNLISPYVLPFVLSMVLIITMLSAYGVKPLSLWIFPEVLIVIAAFFVGNYTNNNRAKGFGLICVLAAVVLITYSVLTTFSDGGVQFFQWFFTGAEVVENKGGFIFAVILLYCSFFSIVVYYFTCVLYRAFFLMLICMIPLLLHTKVLSDVNIAYVCIIVLLNVAIHGYNIRNSSVEKGRVVGFDAQLLSNLIFLGILISVAGIIPKVEKTIYYNKFEALFMEGSLSLNMPEEFSIMNDYSGNADDFNNLANRKLYTLTTNGNDNPYLKRQTFDYYDFEKDAWYYDEYYTDAVEKFKHVKFKRENLKFTTLRDLIRSAAENDPSIITDYNLEDLVNDRSELDEVNYMNIQAENFPSISYIAPERTFYVGGNPYVTRNGVIRNIDEMNSAYERYEINYYDESASRNKWIELGGANLTLDEGLKFLERIKANVFDYESLFYIDFFIEECEYAISYRDDTQIEENNMKISERIRELALSITEKYDNDYEKARALANYFHNNGYVYDIDYKASDNSPEYFLFESKTGTCSDFASAYVLMARSVGLCVRYVEGYKPTVVNEYTQVIRVSNSHAYPEVFIPNMGFIVFEPTISSEYSDFTINETLAYMMRAGANALRIILIVVVIFMIFVFLVLLASPVARDFLFRIRLALVNKNKVVSMTYNRLVLRSEGVLGKNMFSLTPYEMYEVYMTHGCDISPLVDMVEHITYADGVIPGNAKAVAIKTFAEGKKCIKAVKKQNRRK